MSARLIFFILMAALCSVVSAAEPSAFTIAHSGSAYLPVEARDNVTEMRAEKEAGTNNPTIWTVDYYDPTVFMRQTRIRFVDGKMIKVTHPKPFLKMFLGTKRMGWRRMKVDSTAAMALAVSQSVLSDQVIRSTQMSLVRSPTEPVWRITFWVAKPGNPEKTVKMGNLDISAFNGHLLVDKMKKP